MTASSRALREELRAVVAEVFNVNAGDLPDAPTPDNVRAWDSLGHMELIAALEARFGVSISLAESVNLLSESDILGCLKANGIRDGKDAR